MTPDEVKHKSRELKHTAAGRVFLEYLQLRKTEITTQMVSARESVDIFRSQGRAQEIDELIKLLTENR